MYSTNPMDGSFWGSEERYEVSKEVANLWRLAWPVSTTFFLNMSLSTVSVLFVGRLGAAKLAAASLGTSLAQVTGNSVLRGIASAMNTLCGQSYGAGSYDAVGVMWQRALAIVGLTTLPIITLWLFSEPLLVHMGQEPRLAAMTAAYLWYRIPGLVMYGAYICTTNYLQAQGIVRPPAAAAVLTAICHPFVNYLTIHVLGMDYLGAAVATSAAYGLQLVFLLACVLGLKLHKKTWKGWSWQCLKNWLPYLQLALPGLLLMSELWASEVAVMLAGLLPDPARALSIMAIYQTINGLYFMLPLGIGASAATRVANELGAGQPMAAKRAAHVAIVFAALLMCVLAIPLFVFREPWGRVFTNDEAVANGVGRTLLVLLGYVVFDGIQTVVTGVMRGQGRQVAAVPVVLVSYYVIGLPVAALLAFKTSLGVLGLCVGMLVGTVIHATVFIVLAAGADWDADAAQALSRTGITLPMSALEEHHEAASRQQYLNQEFKAVDDGIELPNLSSGEVMSEGEEDESTHLLR